MGTLGRLKHLPLARQVLLLIVFSQLGDDLVGDTLEVMRGQSQNGRTGARQAYTEETVLSLGGHCLNDLGKAGDESLSVGLVDPILHGKVDELGAGG